MAAPEPGHAVEYELIYCLACLYFGLLTLVSLVPPLHIAHRRGSASAGAFMAPAVQAGMLIYCKYEHG